MDKSREIYGGRLVVDPGGAIIELAKLVHVPEERSLRFDLLWCKNRESPVSQGKLSGEAKWEGRYFAWEEWQKSELANEFVEIKFLKFERYETSNTAFICGVVRWINRLSDKQELYYFENVLDAVQPI